MGLFRVSRRKRVGVVGGRKRRKNNFVVYFLRKKFGGENKMLYICGVNFTQLRKKVKSNK